MKNKKKYISGFTLVEVLMSIIITSIAATSMMFVYNQSQKKLYNDNMEFDIDTYGNAVVNLVTTKILNHIIEPVRSFGNGNRRIYEVTFIDKEQSCNNCPEIAVEKTVRISINISNGNLIVTEGNANKTFKLLDGYHLDGGSFRAGNQDFESFSSSATLPTGYSFLDFQIIPLTGDSLYHRLNPSKINAMSNSSYSVKLQYQIETEEDGSYGNQLYKTKTYERKSFSIPCYIREKGKNNSNNGI